jgi:hypothetical protein
MLSLLPARIMAGARFARVELLNQLLELHLMLMKVSPVVLTLFLLLVPTLMCLLHLRPLAQLIDSSLPVRLLQPRRKRPFAVLLSRAAALREQTPWTLGG